MKHIVRIETRRLPKKTDFSVRNQRVSRIKIERFQKRHSACPEPPSRTPSVISYKTSYSPEGTPSSSLMVSPRLSNFEWFRAYKEYRKSSPKYSFHPMFETLQKLRIQDTTYELRMFNKSKLTDFYLLVEDAFSQNLLGEDFPVPNNHCLGCNFTTLLDLYNVCRTAYEDDPCSLSAEPNLQWWVSEISRLLQSEVESIYTHLICQAMEWSLSNRYVNAVDVFYEVGLEMCRAKKSEDWPETNYALDMVDSLIFRGRFLAGKTLLRAIMKEEFHIIDTPCQNHVPHPKWDNALMQSLYWRRGTTQLDVVRWFLAHPDLTLKIFGDDDVPKISLGTVDGLRVNNLVFCFAENEDWTEEDSITQYLINERGCDKYFKLRIFIMLALSRYLPRYGESKLHDRFQGGSVLKPEDEHEDADEDEDDDTDKDEDGMMSVEQDTAPESNLALADGTSFTRPHPDTNTLDMEQEDFGWTALGSQRQPTPGPGEPPSVFDCEFLGLSSGGCVAQIGQLGTEGEGTRTNAEPSAEQNRDPFLGNLMFSDLWDDSFFEHINQAGFMPEETQPILGPSADYQITPSNYIPMIPKLSADYQIAPSNSMPMIPGLSADYQITPSNFMPMIPGLSADYQIAPSNFMPMILGPQVCELIPDWYFDDEQTRMDIDPDVGLGEASSGTERR
ncbi:MAG: hypothetical protein Q9181_008137 [Wetmoreana brouardii]